MDDGREDQNPWTKWYWQDWKTDDGLQLCSLAAQGLWMHMLCTMAKAKRYGYLLIGNKKMELSELALLARISEEETKKLVEELRAKDVFSETDRGVIFCRRMVRQAELSEIRSKAGKQGGRPKAKQKQNESKLKAKPKHDVKAPSASASASASEYASASNNKKRGVRGEIAFGAGTWEGITQQDMDVWAKAYPACDIQAELNKMTAWILANPLKGKKSNWKRFIQGWLNRTQDSGGTRGKAAIDEGKAWAIRKDAELRAKGEYDDEAV